MHAIHVLIRPIYDLFSPRDYKQPSTDKPTFTGDDSHVLDNLITPLLIRLDVELYRDTFLFAYVLRVFTSYFESNPNNPHIESIIRTLLCALYFCENNVGLSYEVSISHTHTHEINNNIDVESTQTITLQKTLHDLWNHQTALLCTKEIQIIPEWISVQVDCTIQFGIVTH